MKKFVLSMLAAIIIFFSVGCSTYGLINKDEFDKKIDTIKVELASQLEGKNQEIIADQKKLILYKDGMAKDAAGFLYGALSANYMKTNPDRIDYIQRVRMEAAFVKLPTPDAQTLIDEKKALSKELDEKNMSISQLEQKYKEKEDEAKKQKEIIAAQEESIKSKEAEKTKLQQEASAKEIELRKTQSEKQREVIAKQTEDLKAKEARERQIRILIYVFTGVGLLTAIGAYALKSLELAGVSAGCFSLAMLCAVLSPLQLAFSALAILLLTGFGLWRKYNKEKQTNIRVIGAVQEAKQENPEAYNSVLKDKLADWFKDHPKGEKHVEETLKELNLK
jgi:hypothetical protein